MKTCKMAMAACGLACGLYEADQMKHPDGKETKVQRKRQFDKLLLERWKARQAAKNGGVGHDG